MKLLVLTALMAASPAMAHDAVPTAMQPNGWAYSFACCSTTDCKELPAGEITSAKGGWQVGSTGEIIPYADNRIKRSQDELFHRCSVDGDFSRPESLCLYVPDQGF